MQFLGLDLIGCRRMPDRNMARDILGTICGKLGMTQLGQPQVEHVDGDKGGYSGSLIIVESHIAFHAFHNYDLIYFDVLSCRPFHGRLLEVTLQDAFLPREIVLYPLHRRAVFAGGVKQEIKVGWR